MGRYYDDPGVDMVPRIAAPAPRGPKGGSKPAAVPAPSKSTAVPAPNKTTATQFKPINFSELLCPSCGALVPLTQALQHQLSDHIAHELQRATALQAKHLDKEKQRLTEQLNEELREQERQLKKEFHLHEEKQFAKLREDLEAAREAEVIYKADAQHREKKLREQLHREHDRQLTDFADQIQTLKQENADFIKREKSLRIEKLELERERRNLDLEVARRLDEQSKELQRQLTSEFADKLQLKDRKIQEMTDTIGELKAKAERGSEIIIGDLAEFNLEQLLNDSFPYDTVSRVGKGIRGADVIQIVLDSQGRQCGTILFESKKTKHWSSEWVGKIKDDQRRLKAEVAVIVSVAVPEGCKYFQQVDGVWVTGPDCVYELVFALRSAMIELFKARVTSLGRQDKANQLYEWMCGDEFRQIMLVIVEASAAMHKELNDERRVFQKNWAKRETQIRRVAEAVLSIYGNIQGIAGGSIQELHGVELAVLTAGDAELDGSDSFVGPDRPARRSAARKKPR